MAGCVWNKELELAKYQENSQKYGVVGAREISRVNARSWRNHLKDWPIRVDPQNKDVRVGAEDASLSEMVRNPVYSIHAHWVDDSIKEMMPVQAATNDRAIELANKGEPIIFVPEQHLREDGEKVIRYFDVWTKDENIPNLYHGSNIDLGKDYSLEEAQERVIQATKGRTEVSLHQDGIHKEAFVLSSRSIKAHEFIQNLIVKAVNETSKIVHNVSTKVVVHIVKIEQNIKSFVASNVHKVELLGETVRVKVLGVVAEVDRKIDRVLQKVYEFLVDKNIVAPEQKENFKRKPLRKEKEIAPLFAFASRRKLEKKSIMQYVQKSGKILLSQDQVQARNKDEEKIIPVFKKILELKFVVSGKQKLEKTKIRVREFQFFSKRHVKIESTKLIHKDKQGEVKANKEKFIRLILLVKKFIRVKEKLFIKGQKNAESNLIKVTGEKQKISTEHTLNFSIAFIFWLLLRSVGEKKMEPQKFNKDTNKKILEREPTPWLLLAIIWHLTMIRESGMRTVQQIPKKKKAIKPVLYPQILPQGVIFAYAS